ncbi:MAG TPA: hypothetical protein VGQ69_09665 [Gemmatimonadales bacterium]|jgi:predicted protein tyrosine phosphatase|nr:hypothetical protein [Gemmatimonadales bacterium]
MTILVCPLSKVGEQISAHRPGCVISLLDPAGGFPELGPQYLDRHLRLGFHDILSPAENLVMPAAEHVAELLRFLEAWDRGDPLLVHCRAGISRSPAAAFIAACFLNPEIRENEIALALRRAAPLARPNETLVALADDALGRAGRMNEALRATRQEPAWVELEEATPFWLASRYHSENGSADAPR